VGERRPYIPPLVVRCRKREEEEIPQPGTTRDSGGRIDVFYIKI
jgi:hypothetical protein